MKFLAFALVAVAAAGCVSEGPSQRSAPKLSRVDLLCEAAGFTPGSADYRQCRAIAELETSIRDEEKAERVARETIGDGLAIEICERFSRRQIRYPIVRRASARASGDYEKTVELSFKIDKSAEDPQSISAFTYVTCELRGREVVDFRSR
ncbi:hypothetical protein LC092_08735 [Stappia stellulata]|uniref:hypothetical protein n=1 Tax=Stappia stellulata TaxID=71235 RepID=UPI001CD4D0F3|nr:hypothetical protein [Stappia stellulata]MCA1242521.1 hypothetical protein [Stappia stellulata]